MMMGLQDPEILVMLLMMQRFEDATKDLPPLDEAERDKRFDAFWAF